MNLDKGKIKYLLSLEKELNSQGKAITQSMIQDIYHCKKWIAEYYLTILQNKDILKNDFIDRQFQSGLFTEVNVSDLHINTFKSVKNQNAFLGYIEKTQPAVINILGDLIDNTTLSKFRDANRESNMSFIDETRECKNFLKQVRTCCTDSKINFLVGNHELWFEKYILDRAPKLYDLVKDLLIEKLDLANLDIEYKVEPFYINDMLHLHGHEVGASGKFIASNMFSKVLSNCVFGHYHKVSHYEPIGYNRKHFYAHAMGCLGINFSYDFSNRITNDFCEITYNQYETVLVKQINIVEGEIYG